MPESLEVEVGGQKAKLETTSLNTLVTVGTFMLLAVMGYGLFLHSNETRDANREYIGAVKDLTKQMRIGNCLAALPLDRPDRGELCKRISE